MMKKSMLLIGCILSVLTTYGQYGFPTSDVDTLNVFKSEKTYEVKDYPKSFKAKTPKNVILMIGDGMGVAHVSAGVTANGGRINLQNFYVMGLMTTSSANNYITDSGAGGSAIASGHKSKNSRIGMDENDQPVKSILHYADEKGLATGLVSTSAITHATPASFIANEINRNSYEEIAADFLKTDIDVFIGGGYDYFTKRKDGEDLTKTLQEKGYQVVTDLDGIRKTKSGKLAALTAPKDNPRVSVREDMLPVATENAIRLLSQNKSGFFMMVEGSQIDWGGHQNNLKYIVEEMLDFDVAIGKALEFAAKDGNTLVIVTADHETGGLVLSGGNVKEKMVKATFSSKNHSATMVPVFAYGPGAENFGGIMDNTDIFKKIHGMLILNEKQAAVK